MRRYALVSLVIALVGISCSSTPEISDPPPPAPVFTGLNLTFEDGRSRGVWGTPADQPGSGSGTSRIGLHGTFPNPFSGMMTIVFTLPQRATVSIWITRERRTGENGITASSLVGSVVNASRLIIVDTLVHESMLEAGQFSYAWGGKLPDGTPAPAGFYRIYMKHGDAIFWCDTFLARSPEDLPEGLRNMLG